MNHDLLEVTVPQLEQMYRDHKYTVTQVVQWYMARIAKYNGIYRAVQNVDATGALATAAREDAEGTPHGPLWGVPIVTKANTSIKGLVTTDGWKGYMLPGHELIAPKDATIVAKLKAAGAEVKLDIIEGAGHGTKEFWTTEKLKAIAEFLVDHWRSAITPPP